MRSMLALAAVLGALAPAAGAAQEWQLRVGGDYRRTDEWSVDGSRVRYPQFDLDLGLVYAGFLSRPDVLSYSLDASYHLLSSSVNGGAHQQDNNLNILAQAAFFQDPRSPVGGAVHYQHLYDDFTGVGAGGGTRTGNAVGADARLEVPDRPWLHLGYEHADYQLHTALTGNSSQVLQTLTGGTSFGSSAFGFQAAYLGHFSTGTYASDNADDHRVDLSSNVTLAPQWRFRLSDTFFLRTPTLSSQYNPHQESNFLTAAVQEVAKVGEDFQQGTYLSGRVLGTSPVLSVEQTQQTLGYSILRTLPDPVWRIRVDASASMGESRNGDVRERTGAESLSATAYWRRAAGQNFVELRAGPSLGLLQATGASPTFGYGGLGGFTGGRAFGAVVVNGNYELRYSNDLGMQGWVLGQQATLGATGPLGGGDLSGQLAASSDRRESTLYGSTATRTITATATYRWLRSQAELQFLLSDGGQGVSGDGLFVPTGYDSRTTTTTLNASTLVWRYFTLRGRLRYTVTDLPDRPAVTDEEAYGAIELAYGSLRILLEDRYLISEVPGGTAKVNQLFIRLDRLFGSRY